MFALGEAFLIPDDDPDRVPHVWVIISDPQADSDRIVLVPMSSFEYYKDCSCRIDAGEHKSAKHESVIEYEHAEITTTQELHKRIKAHEVRRRDNFSKELISRIHEGAEATPHLRGECYDILQGQGLVSSDI